MILDGAVVGEEVKWGACEAVKAVTGIRDRRLSESFLL